MSGAGLSHPCQPQATSRTGVGTRISSRDIDAHARIRDDEAEDGTATEGDAPKRRRMTAFTKPPSALIEQFQEAVAELPDVQSRSNVWLSCDVHKDADVRESV